MYLDTRGVNDLYSQTGFTLSKALANNQHDSLY